jgi:excisionase family DNA binding protein
MPKRTQIPKVQEPIVLEPLLTMSDVQRILQLSKPKVYELMNTRGLPSLKIDGARRFEQAKLQAWIEQQRSIS